MEYTINGLKVFTKGNKNNRTIVFVHGFPHTSSMWQYQVEALKENYYCVTYDIRGLGQSYIGDGQYTMEAFVWDLYSIIDGLHIENPILCGLSMGGYISMRAIEKEQNRFSGLILCDTRSESDNNDGKIIRSSAIDKINVEGVPSFVDDFVPRCFHPKTPERFNEMYAEIINNSKSQNSIGVKGCLIAMISRGDTTKSLSKIKIPTLVIGGTKDLLTPPKMMKGLAKRIKKSKLVIVPKAGHMTPLENPNFVNNAINSFLEKNDLNLV